MGLGNHLFHARKKKGLSQEEVAGKLGVSRQTISKWETDETLPDIRQSKRLAVMYGLSLDELIEFDIDVQEIQEIIDKTNEKVSDKIDWTKAWSKKYPILARYQNEVDTSFYMEELPKLYYHTIDIEQFIEAMNESVRVRVPRDEGTEKALYECAYRSFPILILPQNMRKNKACRHFRAMLLLYLQSVAERIVTCVSNTK